MRDYVIVTDSGCDLDSSFRNPRGIDCLPMHYIVNGQDYLADLDWKQISAPDFYDTIKGGTRITTAQVNQETYREAFAKHLQLGKDVLYVGCSTALSASLKTAKIVAEDVLKDYPDAKIICVDSLRACFALGILVLAAADLKDEGKTIDEVASWLEENKLTANMIGSVDKLTYLKQAGRVSAASAFFGGLLNIKPIIIADAKGQNFAVEKVKGRKVSFERIVSRLVDAYQDVKYQRVFISHAHCIDEAEELKAMIIEKLGKEIDIHIGYVGPCVGATVGPGMIGAYCLGKKVTVNAE